MEYNALSIRPFIGAKDFGQSRNFYKDLGFTEKKLSLKLSLFCKGDLGFYLQDAFVKDWIDNTMVFIEIENLDHFYRNIFALHLADKYPAVKLIPVHEAPWGRECFLHDPSGILWHFGEFKITTNGR